MREVSCHPARFIDISPCRLNTADGERGVVVSLEGTDGKVIDIAINLKDAKDLLGDLVHSLEVHKQMSTSSEGWHEDFELEARRHEASLECSHLNAVLSDDNEPATWHCPDCGNNFIEDSLCNETEPDENRLCNETESENKSEHEEEGPEDLEDTWPVSD